MSTELTKIFTKEFNEALVHQITTDYMANQRRGTKAQKKIDLLLVEVALNLDRKKVQAERELGQQEALYGEQVELHLRHNQKIIIKN
jgi:hypothetical protein